MSVVGIIANPASGKDIRRLVAYGSVFDNEEKVRIVRRVLCGLAALEAGPVLYMPDTYGIVERALDKLQLDMVAEPVAIAVKGEAADSMEAARRMAEGGAACIVTLGGDGTNRAVAKGTCEIPILPISTGTNNVFPFMIEATVAGLAAALVAKGAVSIAESTFRSTKLEICIEGQATDLALVDAAVCDDLFVGSRAVWDMKRVRQIFINRCQPDSIGLSSVGGLLRHIPAESPRGLYLEVGKGGQSVLAPIAPGIIQSVPIRKKTLMSVGREFDIACSPCVLALDGERELEIQKGRQVTVRIATDGPRVIDAGKTLATAARKKCFSDQTFGNKKRS